MASQLDHKRVFAEIEATQDELCFALGREFLPLLRRIQRAETRMDYMTVEVS